ncbi:prepilin peptidase [Novosphingobium soli]|uniref:Prepilin peptidase n=1 Tax=Novosphingobium soli TaxID=574956 RepID=A0ABV6CWE2_9SPHN
MTGALFSYALLAALATALLVAALTDLRRRQIDNGLNLCIAAGAPLWWLAAGFGFAEIGVQLALAAAAFVVASLLFARGQMGGGDVKLLVALALWFTPARYLQVIVLMAVLGGGASFAMAACNMKRVPGETLRDIVAGVVALAWIGCAGAIVVAVATQRPVIGGTALSALARLLPGASLAVAALVAIAAAVAAFVFGFRHIMRRQKSPIEVPYGVAIAAAGLWVIGAHTLPG